MAALVLTDCKITINSVNLSDHITSVAIKTAQDIVETTGFSAVAKTRIAGLAENSVTLEFNQDFAAANVEATIYPLLGSTTTITVSQSATAPGTVANPLYSFTALISEWSPLDGKIGDLATVSVSFPITGTITKTAV